jgi:hypothetical protein
MITPKLTAVMVAVTALIGAGPVAAFAQATNANIVGDLTNAANVETGGNTQVNAAETTQVADNDVEISNEAESGDAEAEGGDAEAEAEAEAESESESGDSNSNSKKKDGDKKDSRYNGGNGGSESESEAEAAAEAIAIGGDADAESGDAFALQVVEGNDIDNSVDQTATTTQSNDLSDDDAVVLTQANVPVQTQTLPIAADVDLTLILIELGLLDAAAV